MPKFYFYCKSCDMKIHKYVSTSIIETECPTCKGRMERQLPNTNLSTEVREIVDPYTNKTWGKDHQAVMKQRKDDHFWEVEVPRLVQTYSTQTCLEEGWLVYNDKGELVINKPPSKR